MEKTSKLQRFIASAYAIVDKKGKVRTNGAVASIRTVEYSRTTAANACRRLHAMGFYLEDVSGIGAKHVDALVKDWHKDGLNPKTLQNQLSKLRIFCGWLGKPGVIREGGIPAYLPEVDPATLKVKSYTERSKSLSGNGVSILRVLDRAKQEDDRLYQMLLLGSMFGLRRKEMLQIKPHLADKGDRLCLDGNITQGGRPREYLIKDDYFGKIERKVIDMVKASCKKDETLGWPGRTYAQNQRRLYYYTDKIGLTLKESGTSTHGLRYEFAENKALVNGLLPPVLGGLGKEMSVPKRKAVMQEISNQLGHGDNHTTGAYFGTFRNLREEALPGHGTLLGSFVLCAARSIVASLFVTPRLPTKPEGGWFGRTTPGLMQMDDFDRENAKLLVVVEQDGVSQPPLDLAQFLLLRPEQKERAVALAGRIGLELSC
jgi:hypothetical protein